MKTKILCWVGMVLCVLLVGVAFGLEYYNAAQKGGTLTADSYLQFKFDGSDTAEQVTVSSTTPQKYKLVLSAEGSTSVIDKSGQLLITLTNSTETITLEKVTVTLYSDEMLTNPVSGKTQTGAGSITVDFDGSQKTYWLGITVPSSITENELENVGGTITVKLHKVGG